MPVIEPELRAQHPVSFANPRLFAATELELDSGWLASAEIDHETAERFFGQGTNKLEAVVPTLATLADHAMSGSGLWTPWKSVQDPTVVNFESEPFMMTGPDRDQIAVFDRPPLRHARFQVGTRPDSQDPTTTVTLEILGIQEDPEPDTVFSGQRFTGDLADPSTVTLEMPTKMEASRFVGTPKYEAAVEYSLTWAFYIGGIKTVLLGQKDLARQEEVLKAEQAA